MSLPRSSQLHVLRNSLVDFTVYNPSDGYGAKLNRLIFIPIKRLKATVGAASAAMKLPYLEQFAAEAASTK